MPENRLEPESDDRDDWDLPDFGETVGYCSRCGEAREAFYTCRVGGRTVPKEEAPDGRVHR